MLTQFRGEHILFLPRAANAWRRLEVSSTTIGAGRGSSASRRHAELDPQKVDLIPRELDLSCHQKAQQAGSPYDMQGSKVA
jgi:hypothetical protein